MKCGDCGSPWVCIHRGTLGEIAKCYECWLKYKEVIINGTA